MKKIFPNPFRNIRIKTSLFVLILLIITIGLSYAITVRMMRDRILSEVVKRAESLCRSIASSAGYSSISQDILGLDTLVFKVKDSNPDIEDIAIVDMNKEILVHSNVNKTREAYHPSEGTVFKTYRDGTIIKDISDLNGDYFEVKSPIVFMDKNLGSVVLSINKSVLYSAQIKMRNRIAWVFGIILFVGTASSIFLTSFLTRPIQELSTGVEELKEGKRSRQLRVYSRDELGRLTESFNEMSALITSQKEKLSKYAQDLEESYVETVKVLAAAIDAKDHYTLGHSTRVSKLSVALAEEVGLSKAELEDLRIACLFHDVGKIKIPDSILLKEGKLEPLEITEMMRHPEYGAEILSKASSLLRYIPVVRHHHEWYDGTGYPDGLRGDEIPLSAAITCLVDAFDAMTSDRPYRGALSAEETLKKIQNLSGKQFSPYLVEKFIDLFRRIRLKYTQGS
ncbi:MAG: HD domain-containing protein [Candidatus Aminicenantes bacterium]|nr:HD domain-containing protein [Candidatus Aminicenantes bacterium]MDH5383928.1 HD domain-containing protein [Candidatus Aminicenantes bacterium]MDH5743903.1 HD domain-containing protein [Candidatus Aminicenantes bacterium]